MKKLIIYHREDNDGVFSGALFYDYLINKLNVSTDDIITLPADYALLSKFSENHTVEDLHEKYDTVIMTDISFNDTTYMKKLFNEFGNNFIWCDHHKPIIDESFKSNFNDVIGVRNTQKSAILCVYEFLYDTFNEVYSTINKEPAENFPEFLRILSGWDSWSYEREGYDFEYVRNVNKGTTLYFDLDMDKALDVIHKIISSYHNQDDYNDGWTKDNEYELIKKMHNIGKDLNDYDDKTMENIIKTSGDCSWEIYVYDDDKGRSLYRETCVIFHQGASNSQMFKILKKINPKIKNGLIFKHNPSGEWTISLYNIYEDDWFHCGEYLKRTFGGGGHAGAAGATLSENEFIKVLKDKAIYDIKMS